MALRLFTADQLGYLAREYKRYSLTELTVRFNQHFALERSKGQIRSALHNHRITSGRTGRFEKGFVPWNSGTKGQGASKPNSGTWTKERRYRKPELPLGYERVSKDGYIEMKVAERNPHTGGSTRFRLKHQVVWEAVNGRVPRGYILRFLDNNKLNCAIDNLVLVSRKANGILNKKHKLDTVHPDHRKTIILTAEVEAKASTRRRASSEGKS